MKLACQENQVPGDSLGEKLSNLQSWGYAGIEFVGGQFWERVDEINQACANSSVKPSTICAGYRGCFLDPDPEERQIALDDSQKILAAAGQIGAVGMIFVPLFGPPRLPDLSPYADEIELEKRLLTEVIKILAETAAAHNTLALLEPLNRYETHLINRLEQGVEIIQAAGDPPGIKIMADFFHMNIEEPHIAESIRAAGDYIAHIHLADSIRWLPGYGHTDFKPGFQALAEIGFDNYMALECSVPGDPYVDLPQAAEYLRAQMP